MISGEECAAQAGDAVPVLLDGGRGHEVLRCQRQEARRGRAGMMIDKHIFTSESHCQIRSMVPLFCPAKIEPITGLNH